MKQSYIIKIIRVIESYFLLLSIFVIFYLTVKSNSKLNEIKFFNRNLIKNTQIFEQLKT